LVHQLMTLQQTEESLKEPPTVGTPHSHYILTTTVGTLRYILNCDVLKDSTQYSHIYTFVPGETPTLIYEGRSINKFQNVTLTC